MIIELIVMDDGLCYWQATEDNDILYESNTFRSASEAVVAILTNNKLINWEYVYEQ